ncbi:hypothetical protein ACWGST_06020 [Agromyces sp. NPDC055520]
MLRLFQAGADALDAGSAARRARRAAAIEFTAGSLSAEYEPGYLDLLRSEWPE